MEDREPGSETEELELQPPRGRGKIIKILALVIAAAVVASSLGTVYFLYFSNTPPVADFTVESVDLHVAANAENSVDPDGSISRYTWDWGDNSSLGSGVRASHDYAAENTYKITLTVADNKWPVSAANSLSREVVIKVVPTAVFIARQDRMTSSFNASNSFVSTKEPITNYSWDFGDGTTDSGIATITTTHTYSQPGRYKVVLEVTDTKGRKGQTSRFVSPAETTVDVLIDQAFEAGCPYNSYWVLRKFSYGDEILTNSRPCTDFYPWVYFSAKVEDQAKNPSWVYSIYRYDAMVRHHTGYSIEKPVILPVFNPSVPFNGPNQYIKVNLSFEYLNNETIDALQNSSFAVNSKYSDGFGYLVRGNITMDLQTSRRIFGVKGSTADEARDWWLNKTGEGTGPSPHRPGPLETKFASWLEQQGNGKYDIFNAFEWYYESDVTWLNATVDSHGNTTVQVFWDGWGYDVLMARWWYWGSASYRDAVCVVGRDQNCTATLPYGTIQPLGWSNMETCWCEHARINATITQGNGLDLNYRAVQEYNLMAWANWGRDKIPGTRDDLPAWVWDPLDMDYVPSQGGPSHASEGYPNSELRWYEGLTSVHGSPGSYAYGDEYEYMTAPVRWTLNPGSTLTIVFPRFDVPWYNPVKSKWNPEKKIGDYSSFMAPMTLRYICADPGDYSTCSNAPQGDYYLWDVRAKTFSMAGPHDWGSSDLPLNPSPWVEMAPESFG